MTTKTIKARGFFISVDGADGAGKSSQIDALVRLLQSQGIDVVHSREPGGTPLGEALRGLLLNEPMHLETEALLMFASRREHLDKVIMPALEAGKWVVCDRFSDATFAYQVAGRGLSREKFDQLEAWVHPDIQPDLSLFFDIDPDLAHARVRSGRAGMDQALDRFELESRDFFNRVRAGYLERAVHAPNRVRIIQAGTTPDEIKKQIAGIIMETWFQADRVS